MSIDKVEQDRLFRKYRTPKHVIRHCNAVADVAVRIAEQLNEVGYELDLDLIRSAACVHDLRRVDSHHDVVGAETLISEGHPREAELVRVHMKYNPFSDIDELTETDVLCLADRVVLEDQYAGIEKRVEYLIGKPWVDEAIAEILRQRMQETKDFIEAIEKRIDMTLDDVLD